MDGWIAGKRPAFDRRWKLICGSRSISLTPGFSPVIAGQEYQNRFNGFARAHKPKPLERLAHRDGLTTRLKPGVNENICVVHFARHKSINPFIQQSNSLFVALKKLLHRLPVFGQDDLRVARTAAGLRAVERAGLPGNVALGQFRRGLAHPDHLRIVEMP